MDDKTLDNIFKTAFNSKSKISQEEGDWDAFEVQLKKRSGRKNFFFFTWNRFNIYYVGILLACLISGSLVYYQNYLWNTPTGNNENTNALPTDTSTFKSEISEDEEDKNTLPANQKVDNTSDNSKNQQTSARSKNTSSASIAAIDSSTKVVSSAIVKDTVSSVPTEPAPAINAPPVVMKRKKTVVLTTPQDTVIKIDTVKVKKGRKK